MRRLTVTAAVLAVLAAPLAGCGEDKTKVVTDSGTTRTVPDVHFAKTKFVLHTGLAIGAFHRYIYKPYRAGKFKKGAEGRRKALVKAALAGGFTYHELKQARRAALSDDQLRPIGDAMGSVLGGARQIASALRAGDLAGIAGLAAGLTSLQSVSSQHGVTVKERPPPAL